jgi:2-haloacid dehalogenase
MDLMTIKALVFDAYGTLYDVQSVADVIDAAFPGRGDYITQIWRMKQLEYSWLRSLMGRYEDFWTVTLESLDYTLRTLGFEPPSKLFDDLAEAYNRLQPYADAEEALRSLSCFRLAILSNGSPHMLTSLVRNTGLDRYLEKTISVHPKRVFKPDPRAYALVEEELGVKPEEVLFVSSNGFDICGAKSFGFKVARIERVSPEALRQELTAHAVIGPKTMFKAMRMQVERHGQQADFSIGALAELPRLPPLHLAAKVTN